MLATRVVSRFLTALIKSPDEDTAGILVWLEFISIYRGHRKLENALKRLEYKLNSILMDRKRDLPIKRIRKVGQTILSVSSGISEGLKRLGKGIDDVVDARGKPLRGLQLKTDEDLKSWILLSGMKHAVMRSMLSIPDEALGELNGVWMALDQVVGGNFMPVWVTKIVDIVADEFETMLNKFRGRRTLTLVDENWESVPKKSEKKEKPDLNSNQTRQLTEIFKYFRKLLDKTPSKDRIVLFKNMAIAGGGIFKDIAKIEYWRNEDAIRERIRNVYRVRDRNHLLEQLEKYIKALFLQIKKGL